MIVHLPAEFEKNSIHDFLNEVIDTNMMPKSQKIEFDFRGLRFIEPTAISLLSNIFDWLRNRGVTTTVTYPRIFGVEKNCPIKYLDDSLFFREHFNQTLAPNATPRLTTIPIQKVAYAHSLQWLDNKLAPWLSRCLNVDTSALHTIKMCIGELFNNIKDHSTENIGCLCAQHYPSKNEIKIAISDFGVGIPSNIRKVHNPKTDSEALELAIQDKVTSKTSPRNLGAGLHTLITNVVQQNKGIVHLISNYGILSCTRGYNGVNTFPRDGDGFYPGTFIEVVLKTDTIYAILDIEEEFEW
ncbi:hypothetical protein [Bacillus badius]|uniref:STAS domain-containing protein n=1 Tax=Bacillus badius TaxID=1455 RepID=A0ABR5AQI0_BACBA|nr:hypothetical protein [Bacillus badius]KIL72504.1 hypothetical protein SD77_3477 [Bacillus badius]MED4718283.1 ATP-binding protein [Bacillus badius]